MQNIGYDCYTFNIMIEEDLSLPENTSYQVVLHSICLDVSSQCETSHPVYSENQDYTCNSEIGILKKDLFRSRSCVIVLSS